MKLRLLIAAFTSVLVMGACTKTYSNAAAESLLRQAEEQFERGEYGKGQATYHRHMQERLSDKSRPEWENPYFYLLLIGDCYLRQGQVEQAIASYQEAQKQDVPQELVADRYRAVARWYEEHESLEKAFEFLQANRHLDPLLFDVMLDRIAKAIVKREDDRR